MKWLVLLSGAVVCFLIDVTSGQGFSSGTCISNCGKRVSTFQRNRGDCGCDVDCRRTRSCCDDYGIFCVQSCQEKCGTPFSPLLPCQCYGNCSQTHCCEDYESICNSSVATTAAVTTTTPPPPALGAQISDNRPIERGYSYITNREVICPSGVAFTDCFINPCTTCPRYPGATCLVNECGGCRAKYVDYWGNEVDCYDPSKFCANGQRIHDCGSGDLCKFASCPGSPRAICVPNKCGGCYYDFVDSKGNTVNCNTQRGQFGCEAGVERQVCEESPCLAAVCRAYPTASCRDIECGECRAEFIDKDGNVLNCNVTESPPCPPSQRCPKGSCKTAKCRARPQAECRESECGNCGATFYNRGQKLRDIDCVVPNACIEKASCRRDPCETYTCAAKKPSICIAEFCDGCNALFFDYQGNRLTKEDCRVVGTTTMPTTTTPPPATKSQDLCPSGQPRMSCSLKRCQRMTCPADPKAFCVENPCERCKPLFYNLQGRRVYCVVSSQMNSNSCSGKCGYEMTGNGGCQCDYNCVRRGDCCSDFRSFCQTCRKSCGLHKPTSLCQCTSDCKLLRNCCKDFDEVCLKDKSCRNRCNENYKFYEPCQCSNSCIMRRNCCPDYKDYCM